MNYFKSLPPDDANCWLNDYVDSSPVHQKHRYAYLMADIEQNLFRGAIRNPEFTGQFSYQIFCSHTYLTIMGGTSTEVKTIQAIAGHADIKMTMERYVHRRVDRILEAGKKMEAAFHERAAV